MSHLSASNNLIHTTVRQALRSEAWFNRLPAADRDRCVSEITAEIAEAANDAINHRRENLGAFDNYNDERQQ